VPHETPAPPPDTPQCEHCKWRATPQRARYGQQKCEN
jgi:hypothetical protein